MVDAMSYFPGLDDFFAPERRTPSPEYLAQQAELQSEIDEVRTKIDALPKISPREALIRMRDEMEWAA
jgi:hypothetical protein